MKRLSTALMLFLITLTSLSGFSKDNPKPSDRAITHNNKGVTALYEGKIDRAIFEFKTAAELTPTYVEAWSNLGVAYKQKGRLDDAKTALLKAIDLDRKFASPYNHLGTVYYELKEYEQALKQYSLAKKYNKKYSDAYYNAGVTYVEMFKQGANREHLAKAVTEFTTATNINSEHPYAHHELARVYQELKQYEQAIIRFKLALEINPSLSDAWNHLAKLYTLTGQTLKAQEALNHAMQGNPQGPQAHLSMGLNFLRDDNYRMAVNEFNKVVRVDPTNEIAYFNIGFAFYKLGVDSQEDGNLAQATQAFTESNKAYESAFKLRPTYAEAAFNIGYNFQLMKDYTNAAIWFQKTIDVDSGFHKAYFSLGVVNKLSGKNTEAAQAFCDFVKQKAEDLDEEIKTAREFINTLGGCPK